ncbi:MAG TPA: peptide deformylase, partial [Dissulfurispiraceae bacterium]|nr:peptide deformylase [Dissulfurispiraceae bacterium]
YPADVLKRKAALVKKVDAGLQKLIDDMIETMHNAHGVGLAAPQVGASRRVVVLDLSTKEESVPVIVLVNPEIIEADGMIESEEGCLSIPECLMVINRAEKITVRAADRDGKPIEIKAEGLMARALQHELDHLDGLVLFDRLSAVKREFAKKRYLKNLQRAETRD